MGSEQKLKPCPFCGGKAEICKIGTEDFIVGCKDRYCHAYIEASRGWTHKKLASDAWNRRP